MNGAPHSDIGNSDIPREAAPDFEHLANFRALALSGPRRASTPVMPQTKDLTHPANLVALLDEMLRAKHEHRADETRTFEHHQVERCECGARRYVAKASRLATEWAQPESALCG